MKTESIGPWEGNYREVVKALLCKSQEIHIRVQGKKLIIKDKRVNFYSCVQMGDDIEIPVYDSPDEEDEIIVLSEPLMARKSKEEAEEQLRIMKEWGL